MKKISLLAFVFLLSFSVGSITKVLAGIYLDTGAKWRDPSTVYYLNASKEYPTYVNDAALYYWNNYTNAINYVKTNDATIQKKVLVYDVDMAGLSWDGQAVHWQDGAGYFSKAEIKLNKPKIENYINLGYSKSQVENIRYRVATHELGHTVGLGDLTESYESDKLMYGWTRPTPYAPTYTDLMRLADLYK